MLTASGNDPALTRTGDTESRARVFGSPLGEAESWEDEREHLRRAYRIGRLPEIVASPFIHAPVDLLEPYDVYLVSELAETDLHCVLRGGPLDADDLAALEERLRAALDVLPQLRLVYSDLLEDNVLRVDGEWKLGDLGGVVGFGEPIVSIQVDEAYRRGGAALHAPAALRHLAGAHKDRARDSRAGLSRGSSMCRCAAPELLEPGEHRAGAPTPDSAYVSPKMSCGHAVRPLQLRDRVSAIRFDSAT